MYSIRFSRMAAKSLECLYSSDQRVYIRVIAGLESLKRDPRQGKSLKHELDGLYSLRIGRYRIIYDIQDKLLLVTVIDLGHRRDIYR